MQETCLIKSPKDCLTTSYWSSETSSLVCTIKAEQKGENDSPVEVHFNVEDKFDIIKMIEEALMLTIVHHSPVMKVIIMFYVVVDGFDVFSCAINSFLCCAILAGIKLKDTITSGTIIKDSSTCFVIYMLQNNNIIVFHLEGDLTKDEAIVAIKNVLRSVKRVEKL